MDGEDGNGGAMATLVAVEPFRTVVRVPGCDARVRARPHAVVLATLVVAAVLVIDPDGWSPFGPSKWVAVAVVTLGGAALAFGAPLRLSRRLAVLWLVFLAWVAFAAAVGVDGIYAWVGTPQRRFGALTWALCALMFAAGHRLDDEGDARLVVGAAVATCGAAGAWAVAEELGWQPVALAGGDRIVGSLGSAAFLGAAMVLLVPIAVAVATDRSWSRRQRGGAGVCAGLGTVALVASGARAAWVGAIAAGTVVAWTHRGAIRAHLRQVGKVALLGCVVVAGLAVITGVAGRVPAAVDSGPTGGLSRLAEWRVATRVLVANPVTGVGPEGYRIAFGTAVDRSYQRRYGRAVIADRAHDSLLDVAVTTGVPGLVLYLGLLALVGIELRRALRDGGDRWLVGVAAGIVAYGIQELFLFPVATLEPAVWLLAGLVVCRTAGEADLITVKRSRIAQIVLAAMAVLVLVGGLRDVLADRDVKLALVALDAGQSARSRSDAGRAVSLAPGDVDTRIAAAEADAAGSFDADLPAALAQLDTAQRVSPRDPVVADRKADLLVQLATASGTAADWARARRDVAGALADDPLNPDLLLQLGLVDAATDDGAAAVTAWTDAADLAPESAAPRANLAALYLRQGRTQLARTMATQALALDPGEETAITVMAKLAGPHGT